ncbi:MAG: Gfo/Idh/MocA family oxidoreductase [Sphingomonadales bacterium]|nr:Gfo/Idh/MocA family oxidoreductase [Sphingomonadales bacterium]
MKVLIIGLGSIGQRHLRLIRSRWPAGTDIGCVRRRNRELVIRDDLTTLLVDSLSDYYAIKSFESISEAAHHKYDVALITSPISMHLSDAVQCLENGIKKLFIEKPLCGATEDFVGFLRQVERYHGQVYVGYQLRFHPLLVKIKDIVDSERLGRHKYSEFRFGEYLPFMHRYEDHRLTHMARADQGGGAINCLAHEIDIVSWLFGLAETVSVERHNTGSVGCLGVEDVANISLSFDEGASKSRIHLNFLSARRYRIYELYFEHGQVFFDFSQDLLSVFDYSTGQSNQHRLEDFRRMDMFEQQADDFLNFCMNEPPQVDDWLHTHSLLCKIGETPDVALC